jgi:hypothetical protein
MFALCRTTSFCIESVLHHLNLEHWSRWQKGIATFKNSPAVDSYFCISGVVWSYNPVLQCYLLCLWRRPTSVLLQYDFSTGHIRPSLLSLLCSIPWVHNLRWSSPLFCHLLWFATRGHKILTSLSVAQCSPWWAVSPCLHVIVWAPNCLKTPPLTSTSHRVVFTQHKFPHHLANEVIFSIHLSILGEAQLSPPCFKHTFSVRTCFLPCNDFIKGSKPSSRFCGVDLVRPIFSSYARARM